MQGFGILVLMIFSRLSRPLGDHAVMLYEYVNVRITCVLIALVRVLLFKLVFSNYAV